MPFMGIARLSVFSFHYSFRYLAAGERILRVAQNDRRGARRDGTLPSARFAGLGVCCALSLSVEINLSLFLNLSLNLYLYLNLYLNLSIVEAGGKKIGQGLCAFPGLGFGAGGVQVGTDGGEQGFRLGRDPGGHDSVQGIGDNCLQGLELPAFRHLQDRLVIGAVEGELPPLNVRALHDKVSFQCRFLSKFKLFRILQLYHKSIILSRYSKAFF